MRNLVLSLALVVLAAGLASTPAEAGFNVGASFTDTTVEQTGNFKADDNKYKIFAGWRFFERQWLGFEAQYVDFGTFDVGGPQFEATSFDVVAILSLKVWRFDFFGKGGLSKWDTKNVLLPAGDTDGTDVVFGVGVGFRILSKLWVRAEWERYEFDNVDTDMASLGVDFRW